MLMHGPVSVPNVNKYVTRFLSQMLTSGLLYVPDVDKWADFCPNFDEWDVFCPIC